MCFLFSCAVCRHPPPLKTEWMLYTCHSSKGTNDSLLQLLTKIHLHVDDACLPLTAVNCGTLTNPANGRVTHTAATTFGKTATYGCNTGYNRVGGSTRTCQATGVWSDSAPTCQGMLLLLCICTIETSI